MIFRVLFIVFAFIVTPHFVLADTGLSQPKKMYATEEGDFHPPYENDIRIVTKDGNMIDFNVELAIKPSEQEKGLMFRTSMADNAGMLFIFRTIDERTFWMKNTLIPLDIVFLEAGGRIQHIHSMAKPQDLSMITSGKPVKAVLEVNGGLTDRLGIKAGDVVHHSAFKNLNLLAQ